MDLSEIRRLVIVAMFSDDRLFHELALKGGNALNLVYKFGSRTSIDVDLSLDADFKDIEDTKTRIFRALRNRFAERNYTVFDEDLQLRPRLDPGLVDERWGGYEVTFKLIETAKYHSLSAEPERARREALVLGPENLRTFKVQISKYEHCVGKLEVEFDRFIIYVYSPEMLAAEKLRAICQQMPEYLRRGHPAPRARDFYDIHMILTTTRMKLFSLLNLKLIADIFRAKEVDVKLLAQIKNHREFHRPDWPSVRLAVVGDLEEFDFYFDFVVAQTQLLESLWIE